MNEKENFFKNLFCKNIVIKILALVLAAFAVIIINS